MRVDSLNPTEKLTQLGSPSALNATSCVAKNKRKRAAEVGRGEERRDENYAAFK